VKPNINSVDVHPQLRHNWHPVDVERWWVLLVALWLGLLRTIPISCTLLGEFLVPVLFSFFYTEFFFGQI
jgi:hypothetical protein